MKDSCTSTFKITLVLYLQGTIIIVLLLSTKGIHMILNAVVNMVILVQMLLLTPKEDGTKTSSNFEVVSIILTIVCVSCTFLLLTTSRLSWHANLKKSLVSGSLY